MSFFSVLRFFTILPAPPGRGDEPSAIGRSLVFFPVVGLIIGIILAALSRVLGLVFPDTITAALIVAALAILTGAHHMDGLMDTFDAMVAGRTRQQRLEIMSDTRVGTFGITAACLLLIIKYAAISVTAGPAAILAFPMVSRWAVAGIILLFPPAKKAGSGFTVKSNSDWPGFTWATVITLILLIVSAGLIAGPVLMMTVLALACLTGLFFKWLFGGLTGDCYGALVEISEALALLLIIVQTPLGQNVTGYNLFQLPFLKG